MKAYAYFTRSRLLLLGLVAVLVFGSCGGGVHGFLQGLGERRRTRLHSILMQEHMRREAARKLTGRPRREALRQAEQTSEARLDSLLPSSYEQRKLQHRFGKIKRQLRHQWSQPAAARP
ncbi:hypothetical protein [Hymenobacter sp. BRD67]|uniref:hypothetical protein n=1 Tax=Hymenobacter sp. BRD67 TaxID=2675877 RepID=UPI001566AF1E|nr:hypothetical protein [Hymenobacter sp. BRD67]QKG54234.1 hypothetical protein GKZ67_18580 [Hymenobacter sp. BRD67]